MANEMGPPPALDSSALVACLALRCLSYKAPVTALELEVERELKLPRPERFRRTCECCARYQQSVFPDFRRLLLFDRN